MSKELSQPINAKFLKDNLIRLHKLWWTPQGLMQIAKWTWSACSKPGDGLADEIKQWWNNPLRISIQNPVPVAKYVPLPEPEPIHFSLPEIDFQLPELPPETIRNVAMTAATVIVIGGMILLLSVGI